MADEDIGGIKIGITADMTQLEAALNKADSLISTKAKLLKDRQVTMTVFAKVDNASFGYIERQLNAVVKQAQQNNAFKFRPKFEMTRGGVAQFNRDMIKQSRQYGGFKIPVIPDMDATLIREALKDQSITVGVMGEWQGWLGNKIPEVIVNVRGHFEGWDEGGAPDVGSGGPPPGGAPPSSRRRGSQPKPPPPSTAQVQPEAKETGKAVAKEISDTAVKVEPTPKEKTGARTAGRPPSSPRTTSSTVAQQACPTCGQWVATGAAWDEHTAIHRLDAERKAAPAAKTAPAAAATPKPAASGFQKCECGANINMGSPNAWADHRKQRHGEGKTAPVAAAAPEAAAEAASPQAAPISAAETARSVAAGAASTASEAAADAGRTARARVNVITQGMERQTEVPGATPLPEVAGNQAVCPFCHQIFTKRGLSTHIKNSHKAETEGLTPGGYSREGLSRARSEMGSRGIGVATKESTLVRKMFEENREIGEILFSPDEERLLSLIGKGLDPDAMTMGLLQPMAELSEEKQKDLLNDPDFKSLQSDYADAIEARRRGIKAEADAELKKVAQNPERPTFRLQALQGAVEDPTAGLAHEIGARRGRAARRAELGISDESLTGFRARDVISSLQAGGPGEAPPGYEEAIQAYAKGEAAGRHFDAAEQRQMDKALLAYKGPSGEYNFGSDMDKLRAARDLALQSGSPADLEEVRRLALGPLPGEDISGLEPGDVRRTGLAPRVRRAAIRSARNPESQRLRFGKLFGDRMPKQLRGPELEFMEAASIGAQMSALLDIEDQRRNTKQQTDQAADTKAYGLEHPDPNKRLPPTQERLRGGAALEHIAGTEARIAERAALAAAGKVDPEVQARREREAEEQAKRDVEKYNREAAARAAGESVPDLSGKEVVTAATAEAPKPRRNAPVMTGVDVEEAAPSEMTAEERRQLEMAEELASKPASCPCGWAGEAGAFKYHEKGTKHLQWKAAAQGATPPPPGPHGPKFQSEGYEHGLPMAPLRARMGGVGGPMFATGGGPEGIESIRQEAIRISEDQPDVSVAGQAAGGTPPATRWCEVCKRPISARMWGRHTAGKEHNRLLQRNIGLTEQELQRQGLPVPPELGQMVTKMTNEAVVVPPPALMRARSEGVPGDIGEMSGNDLKMFQEIAKTTQGQKSLRQSGFTAEQVKQLVEGVPSARQPAAAAAGGGGGGTPAAPKIGSAQLSKILGSDQVDAIRKAVEDDSQRLIEHAEDIRQAGSAVLKENPVRALSVAVGQVLVQTVGGRAKLEAQVKDLNRAVSRQQTLIKRETRIRADLEVNQKALDAVKAGEAEGDEAALTSDVQRRRNILARAIRARRTQQQKGVAPLAEEIQAGRARFAAATLAVGTVGIVAGTALFTAAMSAFSAAMEQGTAWVGRMTDEMTGFATQANTLAKSLGEGALQTGRTEGGIRERFGLAGIGGDTAERLLGPITDRVQGEVQSQRAILMRDTQALAAQAQRLQRPGINNFAGNFQPTGGLVLPFFGQTNINATPSVQETLAGAVSGIGERTVPGGGDFMAGQARQVVDIFTGGALTREITAAQQGEFDTIIGGWNDAMKRGLSEATFVSPELAGGAANDRDLLRAQGTAIRASGGSPDLARKVESGQIALVDANGNLITSIDGVSSALDSLGAGLEKPNLEQIMLAGARQMEAAFYGIARNLQIQLQQMGPIQTFQQLNAQPLAPFGTGINLGAAVQGLGLAGAGALGGSNVQMRNELLTRAARGATQNAMLVNQFGPQAGVSMERYASTLNQINDIGQDIVGWQTQIAEMQLGQQTAEYNRQVVVAQRNISDLQGLVHGVGAENERNIGILQRENLIRQRRIQDIQREGEAESLAMNQRQINFNRALAGFTSSGATPAEAAARFREAELQADFAQRQQDRQVDIFGETGEMIPNERRIVDEQNLRALQDAMAEFDLFQSRFTMDQATRLMADNIALAQQLQAGLNTDMQAMLGALQQAESVMTQTTQDAFIRGSDTLRDTADAVSEVYAQVAADFQREFSGTLTFTPTSSGPPGPSYSGIGGGGSGGLETGAKAREGGGATGLLGNTLGLTNLTVGEAGTETVAVLRNPRQMMMGGGGGTNVQIVFNNPVVRDQGDITKLALAVEEVMNRRAQLYGVGR